MQGKLLINELTIESIEDGDEEHAGKPVNNAMRFYTSKKKKTYICYADSFETKEVWIDAFLKEREKVEHDLDAGIVSQVNIVDGSFEEQRAYPVAFSAELRRLHCAAATCCSAVFSGHARRPRKRHFLRCSWWCPTYVRACVCVFFSSHLQNACARNGRTLRRTARFQKG